MGVPKHILPMFGSATALAAWLQVPVPLPAAPVVLIMSRILKRDAADTAATMALKLGAVSTIWTMWALLVTWAPLKLALGVPLSGWHCLSVYAPVACLTLREDQHTVYAPLQRAVMLVFFDAPLVATAYALREACGLRLFAPFATIIDDDIVQASPVARSVSSLLPRWPTPAIQSTAVVK